jgi:FKBP-type peptidyl-prolyl cis-trans isomerase 2
MTVGERRTIAVAACDGYGEYNKELVLRVDRKVFPPDLKLEVGVPCNTRIATGNGSI